MTTPPYLVDDFIDRPYGEPLFHTESEIAALCYTRENTLWSIEEAGLLREWRSDGRLLNRHFLSDLESVWTFDSQGHWLASASDQLTIWEVSKARPAMHFPLPDDCWILSIAFSNTAQCIACGDEDGVVRIWDRSTRRLLHSLEAHARSVFALSFRPDDQVLATAGEDRVIRLWDVQSGQILHTLHSHTDRIPSILWHPSGELLISTGWDTTARVWDPAQSEPLMLLNSHADQVHTLAFSPDGSLLATADSDFTIHIWSDPRTAKAKYVLQGHSDEIRCLAFSKDGQRLASAGADRVVHIWDMNTGQLLAGPNPRARHAIALVQRPERSFLISSAGTVLHAWDPETSEAAWTPPTNQPAISLASSLDGRKLAVSDSTPDVQLWDLDTRTLAATLNHTRGPIADLAFSRDSQLLATASLSDGLVWIWKMGVAEAILVIPEAAEASTLEAVAFHPNNRWLAVGGMDWLATGGSDGALCVWDLEARDKLFSIPEGVSSLAFDPAGRFLACGTLRQDVVIWDIQLQKKIFTLSGHQDRIGAVVFSPDGSWLVSSSDDCTMRVWNVLSGTLTVARQFDCAIQSLVYSSDGKYLYTGNGNTTCYRLEMRRLLDD